MNEEIEETLQAAGAKAGLAEFAELLAACREQLLAATTRLGALRDQGAGVLALANAGIYLDTFGHVVVGWMWLRQALIAIREMDHARGADRDFYQGKLHTCQYFFRYELSRIPERLRLLAAADDTCFTMHDAWF